MSDINVEELTVRRLSPAEFKFVEHKLYTYPVNQQVVKELDFERESIIDSSPQLSEVTSHNISKSSQTERKALRRVLLEEKAQREIVWIRAIDDVMKVLSDDDKCLVERKYWKQMTNSEVAASLCISESSFKRRRQRVIWMMANRFGLI